MTPQAEALRLLEDALKELERTKGSVVAGVQKLSRAAALVNDQDIRIWCAVQQGERRYVAPLKKLLAQLNAEHQSPSNDSKSALTAIRAELDGLGVKRDIHLSIEELTIKTDATGGGYANIGFLEERYADLVRTKKGNDGTHYKNGLNKHLSYVRRTAHDLASSLLNKIKFAGNVSNCFDVLKAAVDDKLLDLNPALAEQLMHAFKAVSSTSSEEWSQSLTTCRRLLEGLADQLYPATVESRSAGRSLGQTQYINRLWAFMDASIESESNKSLAKTHVDYVGSWLEKAHKITNKGVHAELQHIEALKAVFHVYLVVADLLDYLQTSPRSTANVDLNSMTLDDFEALLGVNRATAKEIVKARIEQGTLNLEILKSVRGVGPKTLKKATSLLGAKA